MNDYGKIAYEEFWRLYEDPGTEPVPWEKLDSKFRSAWISAIAAALQARLDEFDLKGKIENAYRCGQNDGYDFRDEQANNERHRN